MTSAPVLTRRQLRDLERAEREFVPIVTAPVAITAPAASAEPASAEQFVPDAVPVAVVSAVEVVVVKVVEIKAVEAEAEAVEAEAVEPEVIVAEIVEDEPVASAPVSPVVTVVPSSSSYARLLDSLEPAAPRTRAEARRRRDSANLDTVALDISTIIASAEMSASAVPLARPEFEAVEAVVAAKPVAAPLSVDAPTLLSTDEPTPSTQPVAEDAPATDATAPVLTLPRSSRALAASAVSAAKPSTPAPVRRASTRRVAAKVFSGTVMTIVALTLVATSLPADALLTSEDVQAAAQQLTLQQNAPADEGPVQSLEVAAGSDSITIARDGYESSTVAEVAVASGIRMEATFTNNPNGTVQWPFAVGVHIGDQFGYRNCSGCSSNHGGQDFNPGDGAPIQSIADGVVVLAEDGEGSLGVHMIIEHVINGATVASVYAHMQHGTMQFATGDIVKVGQIIGNTGTTGMSTGPHLHFEIREGGMNGTKVDPLQWLYANTN